jgi:hypothetical protein
MDGLSTLVTPRKPRVTRLRRASAGALLTTAVAVAAAGCGSSKPAYCSSVSSLKSSIKALPSTNVIKNGTSALKDAVNKVQTDATSAVSAAKNDFPSETSALTSSVSALETTVKQLVSSPSAAAGIQVASEASAVKTAVENFSKATSSKCG